jgi:3-oxoacyl-[acyl-carrier protein] reductase
MTGLHISLEGKVVLVTGGSRGIGAATVRLFRTAGARVVFSFEQAEFAAKALAAELGGPQLCRALRQPLTTPEEGRVLVRAAVDCFGRLDCLIVNHGIWPSCDQPISTMKDGQWTKTMAVNLDSVFGLVQAGVTQMLAQPLGEAMRMPVVRKDADDDVPDLVRGHIVLIASTAAQRGEAFHADYAASKGALISLTKSLSSELAPQGILANCVAPGWVATEMSEAALRDPAIAARATRLIPMGRVGHVEEIAGPVVFLCTPLAGFISGEVFNVNGGAVLVG